VETRECSFYITFISIEDFILKCPCRWNRTQKKCGIGTNFRMDKQAQSLEAQACKPRFRWLLQPQVPLRELSYLLLVNFTIRQVKKAEARKENSVCNYPHSHYRYRRTLKQNIAVYKRKNSNPSTFCVVLLLTTTHFPLSNNTSPHNFPKIRNETQLNLSPC
jgi:hypothetical protein